MELKLQKAFTRHFEYDVNHLATKVKEVTVYHHTSASSKRFLLPAFSVILVHILNHVITSTIINSHQIPAAFKTVMEQYKRKSDIFINKRKINLKSYYLFMNSSSIDGFFPIIFFIFLYCYFKTIFVCAYTGKKL